MQRVHTTRECAVRLHKNGIAAIFVWILLAIIIATMAISLAACQAYSKTTGGQAEARSKTTSSKMVLTPRAERPVTTTTRIVLRKPKDQPCSSPPVSASSASSPPPPSAPASPAQTPAPKSDP